MLVFTRHVGETIWVGDDVEIIVTGIEKGRVKLGFRAPIRIVIDRGEIRANKQASKPEPRRRTVSEVLWERKNAPGGAGCCDNYANQMGCFCLSEAAPDPE